MGTSKFDLHLGEDTVEILFEDGFFSIAMCSSGFHDHGVAEVHVTYLGECRLYTEEEEIISAAGTVTVIPAGVVHRLQMRDFETVHRTFMMSAPISSLRSFSVPRVVLDEMDEKIRAAAVTGNFSAICPYFAFLCKDAFDVRWKVERVDNKQFIISEFFTNRYADKITLADLARELHVCEKQAARLVVRYMGASFSEVLTAHRMRAARLLLKSDSSLALGEIASMVGYRSYSGFWKAWREENKGK